MTSKIQAEPPHEEIEPMVAEPSASLGTTSVPASYYRIPRPANRRSVHSIRSQRLSRSQTFPVLPVPATTNSFIHHFFLDGMMYLPVVPGIDWAKVLADGGVPLVLTDDLERAEMLAKSGVHAIGISGVSREALEAWLARRGDKYVIRPRPAKVRS